MVNLRHENRNNQIYESQAFFFFFLAELLPRREQQIGEVRSVNQSFKVGGDDCLEKSNRCVIHKLGVNQEASPHSLEIQKQGKDWQETEARRKTLEGTPSSYLIKSNTSVSCWHRYAACLFPAAAKTGRESAWNWSCVASASGHQTQTQTWMHLTAEDCREAGGAGESSSCWPASNCSKVSS